MADTLTKVRKVFRYPLDNRDAEGVATIEVGPNPVVVHVGAGTSPRICAWVEVDEVPDVPDAVAATLADDVVFGETLRFAFVATGEAIPEGVGEDRPQYVTMVAEAGPTGFGLRHVYRLP